jgi:hypothetical protein
MGEVVREETAPYRAGRERKMKIEQTIWTQAGGWEPAAPGKLGHAAQLIFLFGSKELLRQQQGLAELYAVYPQAHFFGCSTAGEICGNEVFDDSLVVTAVQFEQTGIQKAQVRIGDMAHSYEAGQSLAMALDKVELIHVLVLSDGVRVNGSDLVRGLTDHLPGGVTVTGGLSADGDRFQETFVFYEGTPQRDVVAAIGLYGRHLKVGYGSLGGWDPFGPERLITRSRGNILYELDGRSALALYKQYLGEYAGGLPATGLLFPLSLRVESGESGVVRTILGIDEEAQSLIFAGDVPEGTYARLMKANFDRLIDGAVGAARTTYEAIGSAEPDLALLISCVGRKLVLKQRVEEEVEGVRDVLGSRPVFTGFYSYGEISPFTPSARCELHNQTMTITTFAER